MKRDFLQAVGFSHQLMSEHIEVGAKTIDATAGNGYDSLFLAELVGEHGIVYTFDILDKALKMTKELLEKYKLDKRVKLILSGHENMKNYITEEIDGIIFNLGYMPGGDKNLITCSKKTIKAVKEGLSLLKKGGLIVVVIYTGHPGGKEEEEALKRLSQNLDKNIYNVLHYHFLNQNNLAPQVLAIKKRI